VLAPELPQERSGTIANVVFPTGIDRRDDLGMPDRFDVYYGMADDRIGVARLDLPRVCRLEGSLTRRARGCSARDPAAREPCGDSCMTDCHDSTAAWRHTQVYDLTG
jgi:hypothetical protein